MSKQRSQGTVITQFGARASAPFLTALSLAAPFLAAPFLAALSLAGLLAACGGSDANEESTDANGLSPGSSASGAASNPSSSTPAAPLRCGDDFEPVQPLTKEGGPGILAVAGDAVFFGTEAGIFRTSLGDMNPDHAQLLSAKARSFLVLDNQIGLLEGPDPGHVDTLVSYALDGTRGESRSLPEADITPQWTYDAARKSLLGVKSTYPLSFARLDLASGQSSELVVTPTVAQSSADNLALTSAGIITGDSGVSSGSELYRIDPVTGSATKLATGLPHFRVLDADASNAYLFVNATEANPGIYRQPLQGGGMATLISELDGREAYVFVTAAGTFGDNRNSSAEGGGFSLFRIGPDTPAAPSKVADHPCDVVNALSIDQGSLYITVTPNSDPASLLRIRLP